MCVYAYAPEGFYKVLQGVVPIDCVVFDYEILHRTL
jgi:hypothetical protein